MNKTKILALSRLNQETATFMGMEFLIREPTSLQMISAREQENVVGDKTGMVAYLIEHCVLNPDGTRAFEPDEAMQIAKGSGRVAIPLSNAVMKWAETEEMKFGPKAEEVLSVEKSSES